MCLHLHSVVHGLRRPLYEGELILQLPLVCRVLVVVGVSASALRFALFLTLLLSLKEIVYSSETHPIHQVWVVPLWPFSGSPL